MRFEFIPISVEEDRFNFLTSAVFSCDVFLAKTKADQLAGGTFGERLNRRSNLVTTYPRRSGTEGLLLVGITGEDSTVVVTNTSREPGAVTDVPSVFLTDLQMKKIQSIFRYVIRQQISLSCITYLTMIMPGILKALFSAETAKEWSDKKTSEKGEWKKKFYLVIH